MTPRLMVTGPYAFRRSRYKPRERTRRTALAEVGKLPAHAETTIGLVSLASCFRARTQKLIERSQGVALGHACLCLLLQFRSCLAWR